MNEIKPLTPYASSSYAEYQRMAMAEIAAGLGVPGKLLSPQKFAVSISIPKESLDRFSSSMASARESIERFALQVSGEAKKIESILVEHFRNYQAAVAAKNFYRIMGKAIPGSNRTKRLRKKRRKAIEAFRESINWTPLVAHPLCNPIRRLI